MIPGAAGAMSEGAYATTFAREATYWWYTGRWAVVRAQVRRARRGGAAAKVLNLGCGTGATSEALAEFGEVTSADVSPAALAFCRKRGLDRLVEADATALPFPAHTFDLVMALDVLEHVEFDERALAEIRRVLRPGGTAVVTVPAYALLWSGMDDLAAHRRRYLRGDLCRRLAAAGFSVRRATYFNTLLFPLAVAGRLWERLRGTRVTAENFLPRVPAWLNAVLARVFAFEAPLLGVVRFPLGLSILAVVQPRLPA